MLELLENCDQQQIRGLGRTFHGGEGGGVLRQFLICWLKIVIRWCCVLQTIRRHAFLFSSKLKHVSRSWNLPQAIFIEKNGAVISLVVFRCTFVHPSTFEIR